MLSPPVDAALAALADPTRRAIVQRLGDGDLRVTEIAKPYAMSLNAVSKHIRVLEKAEIVRRRRVGREHILSLDPRPIEAVGHWIGEQQQLWATRLRALDALLQAEDVAEDDAKDRKENTDER